jgi:hypothetical protein
MTIEFWPKRLLRPTPRPVVREKKRRVRRPQFPIHVGIRYAWADHARQSDHLALV